MSGVGRVVRFNWPQYAAAGAGVLVAAALPPLRAAAVLAAGWLAAGLVATWWAYDRSPLYRWRWLLALLPAEPARYAVVSTGLDEVSAELRRLLPAAEATVLDLYHPDRARTGSIRRARALVPAPAGAMPAHPGALGAPDASFDAVFAAHELRERADRRALHAEIARTLRPGGHLVLVEHCRDAANVAAYGPGAWHFYPRGEWLRLARGAGLAPVREAAVTALVRAMVHQR